MPLAFLKSGETGVVKGVNGRDDTKRFLESLGFVAGAPVSVISELSGNMILSVKDTRIALDRGMARRIMV
ncbi:MAG: ferrous iron transport protein A [Clostridiales Family XIII bacterium]|jgi:ferrous iron transport protein A|nr:ferrous iron transport protein A [Clostridiales Family XIII bacterium]